MVAAFSGIGEEIVAVSYTHLTQQSFHTENEETAGGDVGVSIEKLRIRTLAHGVQPQQHLTQDLLGVEPVSYTHLDVYKRQGHSGLLAAFRALARAAFCASLAIRGGTIFIHDFGMV